MVPVVKAPTVRRVPPEPGFDEERCAVLSVGQPQRVGQIRRYFAGQSLKVLRPAPGQRQHPQRERCRVMPVTNHRHALAV